jgi:hypothetical protein
MRASAMSLQEPAADQERLPQATLKELWLQQLAMQSAANALASAQFEPSDKSKFQTRRVHQVLLKTSD